MQGSKFQPALLGGVFIGVLSALPIISAGNMCCCLWVLAGGALATYLLQQNQSVSVSTGDGAIVGLLAGLVGAVVHTVLAIPIMLVFGPVQMQFMRRILEGSGDVPPEVRQMIENMGAAGAFSIFWVIFTLFSSLVIDAIFGALGGMLGTVLFKKKLPPAPPPPQPIPPPLT
jgi:hypothetical protein